MEAASLDVRGVFVLHTSERLFVWVGHECGSPNSYMEQVRLLIHRLQTHERAPDEVCFLYSDRSIAPPETASEMPTRPASAIPLAISINSRPSSSLGTRPDRLPAFIADAVSAYMARNASTFAGAGAALPPVVPKTPKMSQSKGDAKRDQKVMQEIAEVAEDPNLQLFRKYDGGSKDDGGLRVCVDSQAYCRHSCCRAGTGASDRHYNPYPVAVVFQIFDIES